MPSRKLVGQVLLYGSCTGLAAAMLGYYWLGYIPSQSEYFATLRFHTLASIADQLHVKVENLANSYVYAVRGADDQAKYLATLVPELKYKAAEPAVGNLADIGIEELGDAIRFRFPGKHPADASLRGLLSRVAAEDLFDDVLVTDGEGHVLFQRSSANLTVLNLPGVPKAMDFGTVRPVQWNGTDFSLLLQPVSLSARGRDLGKLMLCGAVRTRRLAQEARHVPPAYLLAVFVPLVILVLAGPFLKILMLTRTARLAFHDLALLAVCAVFGGAILAVFMASWRPDPLGHSDPDPDLSVFAGRLNHEIVSDVRHMYQTLQKFDAALPVHAIKNRMSILESDTQAQDAFRASPFEFVYWTSAQGCQVAKWAVNSMNTERVPQRERPHFQNVASDRMWWFAREPQSRFTLVPQISPTTSQLIVVMAIRSAHGDVVSNACPDLPASPIFAISLVGMLPSVSWPLLPPDVGFAVFEPDGRVLFHSKADRNLHENLFLETDPSDRLRAAVAMRAKASLSASYRGRPYRMTVQPVTGIAGIPWSIAVFRETEPQQATTGLIWGDTLILFTALMGLLLLAAALASVIARIAGKKAWQQVDWALSKIWADEGRTPSFRRLARDLLALTVLSAILLLIGILIPYRSGGWVLWLCLLAPLAAFGFMAARLWRPAHGSGLPGGRPRPVYALCLTLCLLLVSVIPSVGMLAVSRGFESRAHLALWQQKLSAAISARRARMWTAVQGAPGLSAPSKEFLGGFLGEGQSSEQQYIRMFNGTQILPASDQDRPQMAGQAWWEALLTAVRPELASDAIESGTALRDRRERGPCRATLSAPDRQTLSCPGSPVVIDSALPAVPFPVNLMWWILALVSLGAAFAWNCLAFRKSFSMEFHHSPLPLLTGDDWTHPQPGGRHLLILGLPLSGKDQAVIDGLGFTPPRVNLYQEHVTPTWADKVFTRIRSELEARVARPPIVHISNLETKLADAADRQAVLDLIGRLSVLKVEHIPVRVVMTSAVDPVFHLDSLVGEAPAESALSNPDLQRMARLLHGFRKVGLPRQLSAPELNLRTVRDECCHHPELVTIGKDVEEQAAHLKRGTDREVLLDMIAERAGALYKVFWACCTRPEKRLLIQLANTGFVNPACFATLDELMRKGLVVYGGRPRIMNETFRRFLAGAEEARTVRTWEGEAGTGSWAPIRNILLAALVLGLFVVAVTQADTLQTASTIIGGVVAAMAGVTRLLGYFSGKPPTQTTS